MLLFLLAACAGVVHTEILGLKQGDDCRPLGGGHGQCKLLSECRDPGDFKKEPPPICTFVGKEPVICCPDSLTSKTTAGQKAQLYCAGIKPRMCPVNSSPQRLKKRAIFRPTVVGGTNALPKTTPFMALIGYGNENEKQWSCGGSLINARYVLSAAHCVNPYSLGNARWARLGELDLSSNKEDAKPIDKRIVERISHPDYVDSEAYNDIALFKLDSDVVFNAWVLPVCLNTKRSIAENTATVTGWGRTDFASGTSEKLLEADLNLYNDTECERLMFSSKSTKTPLGYQPDKMFCAGVPDGSKDSCSGDSGGPLVVRKTGNCVKTQIGITSYGRECGRPDSPGVYTRVSHYVAWIEDIAFDDGPLI